MSASAATHIGASLLVLCIIAAPGCGKKGPPLAPMRRVPAAVADLSAARYADRVFLRFTVPSANVEGPGPANLALVEVYGLTIDRALTPAETQSGRVRAQATLVAQQRVRLPAPPVPEGANTPQFPVAGEAHVGQGEVVDAVEALTAESSVPVALLIESPVAEDGSNRESTIGPLVAPTAEATPHRFYFAVGITERGRYGDVSAVVPVPLTRTSSAPTDLTITHDETSLLVKWSPPSDARVAAEPGVTEGVLTSRPLLPAPPATQYEVFDAAAAAADNAALRPVPLTAAPLATPEFRVADITFGKERCFAVRAVDQIAGTAVRGPASPRACVTPLDIYPPAAPQNLAAVAGAGTISLIWEPNSEPDLAGYIVLRGDAPGATLAPLTPSPIRETTFRDTTVRAGTRYVYAVVAVDAATPQNVSAQSARVEETGRQ